MSAVDDVLEDSFFESYNAGRLYGANLMELDFGVWSAILDGQACDFCAWADGRTFHLSQQVTRPPAHFGCRCVISYYNQGMLKEDDEDPEQVFLPWEGPPEDVYPFGSKKGK